MVVSTSQLRGLLCVESHEVFPVELVHLFESFKDSAKSCCGAGLFPIVDPGLLQLAHEGHGH